MSSRQMHRFLDSLGFASGSGGGGSAGSGSDARDIFRQRLQAASDANLAATANRNDAVRRKLEQLKSSSDSSSEASDRSTTNTNPESEDA